MQVEYFTFRIFLLSALLYFLEHLSSYSCPSTLINYPDCRYVNCKTSGSWASTHHFPKLPPWVFFHPLLSKFWVLLLKSHCDWTTELNSIESSAYNLLFLWRIECAEASNRAMKKSTFFSIFGLKYDIFEVVATVFDWKPLSVEQIELIDIFGTQRSVGFRW